MHFRKPILACFVAAAALLASGCNSGPDGGTAPVVGNRSDDARMQSEVDSKLKSDPALASAHVSASTSGAQITLSGTVTTIAQHDAAERVADSVAEKYTSVNGGVVNNLMVGSSGVSGK